MIHFAERAAVLACPQTASQPPVSSGSTGGAKKRKISIQAPVGIRIRVYKTTKGMKNPIPGKSIFAYARGQKAKAIK
jgi:hypothetical protein